MPGREVDEYAPDTALGGGGKKRNIGDDITCLWSVEAAFSTTSGS